MESVMQSKIERLLKEVAYWETTSTQYLLKDRWLTLRADSCNVSPAVSVSPYYVIEGKDSIHAVVVSEDGNVLLTCQYRHGAQVASFEFPCGELNSGEDAANALARELLEETGCSFSEAVLIGTFYANPARQTNKVYTYLCTGARLTGKTNWDETERIGFDFFTAEELTQLIRTGQFAQGLHLASWYLAIDYLNQKGDDLTEAF
jgi:ADP-ribose pyrophosphatase